MWVCCVVYDDAAASRRLTYHLARMNTSTKCYVSTTALVIQSASAYHITPYTAHSMQTKISPFVQTLVCQHLSLIRPTWHTHTHTQRPPFTSHHHFILMHSFILIHSFIHSCRLNTVRERDINIYLPARLNLNQP